MIREDTMQSLHGEMIEWRRYLHRHPELSFKEYRTSDWLADKLESWGLQVRRGVAGTGIVARLVGGLPGRTIALRSDIDALAIQDEKTVEYASSVPGVMHACGHDGHMAELLAVACYYSRHQAETAGTRVFLFQPGEEVLPGGAIGMIRDGALEGVDAIYGVHLWSPLPYGVVATRPGPFMASPDEFEIVVTGKGGHGGLPHQSVDAIVAGAHMVTALQTIVSRNVDPLHSAVVSVGRLQAGTANNVIAERCLLAGTVRTFDEETRRYVSRRLEEVVRHVSDMHGTKASFDFVFGYPPVVNDESEAERVLRIAGGLDGIGEARRMDPVMAGEDFSYYLKEVPGCFFFVGAGAADGSSFPHHHPRFDIDERAMLDAARLLVAVADDSARDSHS
ncbi:M20 metallopeptidase family protein [Cohnella thailandensis]|uniref:Amidohydrolase n=1 Tax=Cohnella thailandensis TaxID=557557 RepID=A0A841T5M6_9BACL|nr:amidohydrolase [Cohnella thailandensis]MBB6636441.1 amidohydrolase [Cohnella thailandensis]